MPQKHGKSNCLTSLTTTNRKKTRCYSVFQQPARGRWECLKCAVPILLIFLRPESALFDSALVRIGDCVGSVRTSSTFQREIATKAEVLPSQDFKILHRLMKFVNCQISKSPMSNLPKGLTVRCSPENEVRSSASWRSPFFLQSVNIMNCLLCPEEFGR
jgi:hypothetical protein